MEENTSSMGDNSDLDMDVANDSDVDDAVSGEHWNPDISNSINSDHPGSTESPQNTNPSSTINAEQDSTADCPDASNPGTADSVYPVALNKIKVADHADTSSTEFNCGSKAEADQTLNDSVAWINDVTAGRPQQQIVGKFACTWCQRVFKKPSDLRRHERLHTGEMFKCTECSSHFSQGQSLTNHIRLHHTGETPFVCGYCPEKFAVRHHLKGHIQKTHKALVEIFKCKICGEGYETRKCLREHTTELHGSGPHEKGKYTCQWCPRVFPYPSDLKRHLRVHTGEKPYSCEICQMSFRTGYERNRHVNKHRSANDETANSAAGIDVTNDFVKMFECDICGNSYFYVNDLNRHLRKKHKIELPWQCNVCKLQFNQRDVYLKHKADTHFFVKKAAKPLLECQFCGKTFKYASDLARHEPIHSNDNLSKRAKVKSYTCRYCEVEIQGKEAMQEHRAQCTKPILMCDDCGKTFPSKSKLSIHILVHSGERKYTCDICQKSFKQAAHLKGHKGTHTSSFCTICGHDVNDYKRHMRNHHHNMPIILSNTSLSNTSLSNSVELALETGQPNTLNV